MIKISRPPIDLTSFIGRKWLESLTQQSLDLGTILNLSFVLISSSALLPNSRTLAGSSNIELDDSGSGGNISIDLTDTGVAANTYGALNVIPVLTIDDKGRVTNATSIAVSSAPPDATFLTLSLNSSLTNERVLTASSNVSITDAGANSTATLDLTNTGVTAGTYTSVTVDAKGRVTAGSDITSLRRTFLFMGG